jgi:4-amino-4-deoxy-L-arabinose transferase-like glycosyltransferase
LIGAAFGAIAVGGFALWADSYAAHGLDAVWRTTWGGREVLVERRVEHRTAFPNVHRPQSRYVQAWDFERWGIPDRIPSFDVTLRGTLEVPPGAPRRIRAVSPGEATLRVDGRDAHSSLLLPGVHAVEARWRRGRSRQTALEFQWAEGISAAFEEIPSRAFRPSSGSWPPLRRALWIAAVPGSLLVAGGLFLVLRAAVPEVRRRRLGIAIGAAILALAMVYRLFDYAVMPPWSENADELFATWNGWQLLEDGTTRGWTFWPKEYGDRVDRENIRYFKWQWAVVSPTFEHPPLLHVLVGAAAKLGGASHWAHSRLRHTRLVPIALSGVTLILMMAIGRKLDPGGAGPLLGALLYAVLPPIVLQTRVVKEEALLVPLSLLGLLLFLRWRDDGERNRDIALAGFVMGLCASVKVPGAFFVPALLVLVLERRRWRAACVAGAAGVLGLSLLFLYAAAIDWDLFWFTTFKQASFRPAHWNMLLPFFTGARINRNWVGSGWLVFLWIAYVATMFSRGRGADSVMVVPPLVYLVAIAVASGTWNFGWYVLPVYPFLCLGAGQFLAELWRRPDFLRGWIFVALPLLYLMNFTTGAKPGEEAGLVLHPQIYAFLAGSLTPYLLVQVFPSRRIVSLARVATAIGLATLVLLSGCFVANYDAHYVTYKNFDLVSYDVP